jgi:6-phosphofructokinase 2
MLMAVNEILIEGAAMKRIVTLTLNPCIDLSCTVDSVEPEHKLRTDQPRREPGGGGINVSRAIAKLGGRSAAHHMVGGHTGDLLCDLLDAEGIEHHPVRVEGLTRENVTVSERGSDRQFRFVMPGAAVDEDAMAQCLEAIFGGDERPDYLVISGSLPPQSPQQLYALAVRRAGEHACRVVLDATGTAFEQALEQGVYLIKPNRRELGLMVGRPLRGAQEIAAAASQVVTSGRAEVVAASLGADGMLLATAQSVQQIASPKVEARSRVGAGDSTVAGITLALARGADIDQAVRFGVACGAAAVMTPGTELCRCEDAERLYEAMENPTAGTQQR